MSAGAKTLDHRLRARAEKELRTEIREAFDKIVPYFFGGDSSRNVFFVSQSQEAIRESTDPQNSKVDGYTIDVRHLFDLLRTKALENDLTRRGDAAVQAFMDRVESLGEEIEELRGRVLE